MRRSLGWVGSCGPRTRAGAMPNSAAESADFNGGKAALRRYCSYSKTSCGSGPERKGFAVVADEGDVSGAFPTNDSDPRPLSMDLQSRMPAAYFPFVGRIVLTCGVTRRPGSERGAPWGIRETCLDTTDGANARAARG